MDDHPSRLGDHGRYPAQRSRRKLKTKMQFTLKRLLLFSAILSLIFAFVFSNWFLTVYSCLSETPVSWMRSSSPMKPHLAYVFNNLEDPNLENSEAVKQLRSLIEEELSTQSTKAELAEHIKRHFRNPNLEVSGASVAGIWRQDAHGYRALMQPEYSMQNVCYFFGRGKFLFAAIDSRRGNGYIYLSEPFDVMKPSTWPNAK